MTIQGLNTMNDRQLLLLGILRQQEMHGYQLYDFIERALAPCTDMKKATAYYMLNKMAEEGWISEEQTQEGNRPPRKVYQITRQGEQVFQDLLHENLSMHNPTTFPGDIGMAFLDTLQPAKALKLLQKRRAQLTKALEEAQEVPRHGGSLQLVIEHQKHHLAAELTWLDKIIAQRQEAAA
jgi:DNA-binding PadR family transcriptional regulator